MIACIRSMVQHGSGVKHIRKFRSRSDDVRERFERIAGRERPESFSMTRDHVGDDQDPPIWGLGAGYWHRADVIGNPMVESGRGRPRNL